MSGYTEGPWEAIIEGDWCEIVSGEEILIEGYCSPANARLIAASPELLEVCKRMSDYRHRAGAMGFQLEKADDFIREMRRIFDKAEGKA